MANDDDNKTAAMAMGSSSTPTKAIDKGNDAGENKCIVCSEIKKGAEAKKSAINMHS